MRHAALAIHQELIDTEPVGGRRAQGHQQIHVARAGPQRLPAGPVKARAEPELNRRGEQPLQPAAQHPVLAQQLSQHGQRQRRRQRRGHGDGPPVGTIFLGGAGPRGRSRAGRLKLPRPVTGFFNDRNELRQRHGASREPDLGDFGGQIDFGRKHARQFHQRFFNARDAGGAAHVANLESHRLLAHGVTGFFHRALQCFHADRAARLDAGLLGRKINAGLRHPRQAGQGFFHPCHARRAGHALHRKAPFGQGGIGGLQGLGHVHKEFLSADRLLYKG